MFKHINNKSLSIVFAALLAVVLLVFFVGKDKGARSFKSQLVEFKTDKISSITTHPQGQKSYTLKKNKDQWMVDISGKSYPADENGVNRLLDQIGKLRTNQVVARSEDRWADYDVTDSLGTNVVIEAGNKTVGLVIGKLNFDRKTRSSTTYVRENDDDIVYGVDGFLSMAFRRKASDFRDKTIVDINSPGSISKIFYEYDDGGSFELHKKESGWFVDETKADSAAVANYLNDFIQLKGRNIAKVESEEIQEPELKIRIEGEKMDEPVKILAGNISDEQVIHSTQNPLSFFSINNKSLKDKIFVTKEQFIRRD
jgi:hypothetical protein